MQRATISTGVPALASRFSCPSTDLSWCPISVQNCSLPLKRGCSSTNSHSSCSASMLLSDLSWPSFPSVYQFRSSTLCVGDSGRDRSELPEQACPEYHLCYLYCQWKDWDGWAYRIMSGSPLRNHSLGAPCSCIRPRAARLNDEERLDAPGMKMYTIVPECQGIT
jgi:hypothetical protein